jgi:predicted phosphoribosyltransferase
MPPAYFIDRVEAGELLAKVLEHYRGTDALVLAIPRGGVVVGHALARVLGLPLDIVLAKKIGHPNNPELAIGAVSPDAVSVDDAFRTRLPPGYVERETTRIRAQMQERTRLYRGTRPPPVIEGRAVIVVDDGVATGHTLLATLYLVRMQHPARIVVAIPVVPFGFVARGRACSDEFIHLIAPEDFQAVGQFYEEFEPVEDDEVARLMKQHIA